MSPLRLTPPGGLPPGRQFAPETALSSQNSRKQLRDMHISGILQRRSHEFFYWLERCKILLRNFGSHMGQACAPQ
jgi:hypothetical protein